MFDSVPGMGRNEGRKSLWTMMESVRGAGLALLNDEVTGGDEPGVYFDGRGSRRYASPMFVDVGSTVLGHAMVTCSMRSLFVIHVAFLVVGPISILSLLAWVLILTTEEQSQYLEATVFCICMD